MTFLLERRHVGRYHNSPDRWEVVGNIKAGSTKEALARGRELYVPRDVGLMAAMPVELRVSGITDDI